MASTTENTTESTVEAYTADEELFFGRARAANPGDVIHSTPEQLDERGWADKVTKVVAPAPARVASVEEVLAEVGDDKEKAAAALAAEQETARPRTTLVAQLERIVAA